MIFLLAAKITFFGKSNVKAEKIKILVNFLLLNFINLVYNIENMKTIFLFFLTIYIAYYLFRPVTEKEIKKFNDPDNWSNMGF
jgi:hypothetical protein